MWGNVLRETARTLEAVLGEDLLIAGEPRRGIFDVSPWQEGGIVGSQPTLVFRGNLPPGTRVVARGTEYEITHTSREPDGTVKAFLMEVSCAHTPL